MGNGRRHRLGAAIRTVELEPIGFLKEFLQTGYRGSNFKMMKIMMLSVVLATALAAPVADPVIIRSEIKTPASTSKLTPIVAPIISPIAHIPYPAAPLLRHVSPYAYTYSAPVAPVAYVPGSYSIEQHGYNIAY